MIKITLFMIVNVILLRYFCYVFLLISCCYFHSTFCIHLIKCFESVHLSRKHVVAYTRGTYAYTFAELSVPFDVDDMRISGLTEGYSCFEMFDQRPTVRALLSMHFRIIWITRRALLPCVYLKHRHTRLLILCIYTYIMNRLTHVYIELPSGFYHFEL